MSNSVGSPTPFFVLTVSVFIILVVVFDLAFEDEVNEYAHYCEMTRIYKATDGKYGWPPYDGECT